MQYRLIGTWGMALDGIRLAAPMMQEGASVADALGTAICAVEDCPDYATVGFGGLPNRAGEVELDAAYMDGDSLYFGGIIGVRQIRNPILVAQHLSQHRRNCLLCGAGAEGYAQRSGFAWRNMLTESAKAKWQEELTKGHTEAVVSPNSHDTVCMVGLDSGGHMAVGVSTSGLFMKHPGRVGDSPIIGSGFYCDGDIGGAAATGLGEDIMKGCLSYEIVRGMRDGLTVQQSCDKSLAAHLSSLTRRGYSPEMIAVIAMDAQGNVGAASTLGAFAFAVVDEHFLPALLIANKREGGTQIVPATALQLEKYKSL